MWKTSPSIIQAHWNSQISGFKMFVLVTKMKKIKVSLKELNRISFTDIQGAYLKSYHDMISAQEAMHLHPSDQGLADFELNAIQNYKVQNQAYLEFF